MKKKGNGGTSKPDVIFLKFMGVAALLGISRRQAYRLRAMGKLPAPDINMGTPQSLRWRSDRLLAWADAGCPRGDAWESLRKLQAS